MTLPGWVLHLRRDTGHPASRSTGRNEGQVRRWPVPDQSEQGRGVRVLGNEVAQHVELAIAHGREGHLPGNEAAARRDCDPPQDAAPESVALEDPVPGGA